MTEHDDEYHFPPVERALTELEVFRLGGDLRNGWVAPEDAPEQALVLIAQFVAAAYAAEGPSRELTAFVRDALGEFLDGKSLEAAFRVKQGRRGRPNADPRAGILLAKVILRDCVVRGLTLEASAAEAAAACASSRTNAYSAFHKYKNKAIQEMRMRTDGPPEVNEAFPLHRDRIIRLLGVAIA